MDEHEASPHDEHDSVSTPVKDNKPEQPTYLTSPPYWLRERSGTQSTTRSLERPPPITLKDNTDDDYDDPAHAHQQLWARSIAIDDYVVVKGSNVAIGAYVVWICKVETLDGSPMIIRKRYSEFDELRNNLLRAFPDSTDTSLPALPPKSAIYKFKPKFLEKRRAGLAYFLNCVMLSPQYASSIIVKEFICRGLGDG